MIALVTALIVSGAALSVPHASSSGAIGLPPMIEKKHAAYLQSNNEFASTLYVFSYLACEFLVPTDDFLLAWLIVGSKDDNSPAIAYPRTIKTPDTKMGPARCLIRKDI
jgi:hypothetical protein